MEGLVLEEARPGAGPASPVQREERVEVALQPVGPGGEAKLGAVPGEELPLAAAELPAEVAGARAEEGLPAAPAAPDDRAGLMRERTAAEEVRPAFVDRQALGHEDAGASAREKSTGRPRGQITVLGRPDGPEPVSGLVPDQPDDAKGPTAPEEEGRTARRLPSGDLHAVARSLPGRP